MSRALAAAALAGVLLPAAPAAALGPEALAGDPLDRAAAIALPAVYRLESAVDIDGLVDREGRPVATPAGARRLAEVGTAFGVGQGGHLVGAAHVAFPSERNIAVAALRVRDADRGVERTTEEVGDWVDDNGVRPVGVRLRVLVARQADAGAGGGRRYVARLVRIDRRSDLALVRLPAAPSAPVLPLATSSSRDTPVVTIGFGTGAAFRAAAAEDAPMPVVRKGRLGDNVKARNLVPGKQLVRVDTVVRDGDSGGPAVDVDGHVRGVVLFRDDDGGYLMRSGDVNKLLTAAGVDAGLTPADRLYRRGLEQLWALDFTAARGSFAAAAQAFPAHTLAAGLRDRAIELDAAEFRVAGQRRPQAFLLALGIVSAIAALACALALAGPAIARAYRPDR